LSVFLVRFFKRPPSFFNIGNGLSKLGTMDIIGFNRFFGSQLTPICMAFDLGPIK
jgi:hypothetical protein